MSDPYLKMIRQLKESAKNKSLTFSGWLTWKGIEIQIGDPRHEELDKEYNEWLNES